MTDMAELKVTITGGRKNLGEEMTVALDGPVIVGRSHSASIRFSNEEADVSGKHLEFSVEGGQLLVRNLKRDIKVNGAVLATGERRPVKSGDSFEIGARARFRIDSISGVDDAEADAPSSATGATRAMTEGTFATATANPTMATRLATETVATRVATETEATRLADATNLPNDSDETVAMGFSDDLPGDDRPTDALTGDGVTTTGSAASTGGGETIALDGKDGGTSKIPQWLLDDLNKKQRQKEAQKRHMRQTMLAVAMLAFGAVLGGIVYMRWPRAERWLSVPKTDGKPDVETFTVSSSRGNAFVVDFPRNGKMRKEELQGGRGIDVSTFTGKDRDVPFRLRLSRSSCPDELTRSLEECASVKMSAAAKSGFVFKSPGEWPAGRFFFESEYPGSCHSPRLMRGSAFYRSEYEAVRTGLKWHGVLIVFRDGDVSYAFQREIPESEWERGKLLLRKDPNIEFYPAFLAARWESPGKGGLVKGMNEDEMMSDVRRELDMPNPRVSTWPRIRLEIDTLVALSWGKAGKNTAALALLEKFRRLQDSKYIEFRNEFELAKTMGNAGRQKMESVRADCHRVFGIDPSDRRYLLINNPENWSCLKNH